MKYKPELFINEESGQRIVINRMGYSTLMPVAGNSYCTNRSCENRTALLRPVLGISQKTVQREMGKRWRRWSQAS